MIEYITIQNFQSHSKTRVDFDPGITTIIGPSDVGKSAIIRALKWVCTNEPGGDAYIKHGAKGCTVRVSCGGHVITRKRGGTVNEYHIDDQEYKAFGRGVPEPVTKLLNLGPVCWQGQHDSPYWFTETAGEVSRQLNSIVNLGIIDDVLAGVAAACRYKETKLEVAEEALTTAKKEHTGMEWVDAFVEAVEGVEGLAATATEKRAQFALVSELSEKAANLRDTAEKARGVHRIGQKAVVLGDAAYALREKVSNLAGVVSKAKRCKVEAAIEVPDLTELESLYNAWHKQRVKALALRNLLTEARQKKKAAWQAEIELKDISKELPKTCPTCGK